MSGATVDLFLCGDVMLGRGIDQVLGAPGDPTLRESYLKDAREYVRLVERANGPIPAPVEPAWPWGDALTVLEQAPPDARIVNLETTVTRSDDFAPGKAVHYRIHPPNIEALTVVRPDVCVLANNHVMDFGVTGLEETLDHLDGAGLRTAGAGRDQDAAWRPAAIPVAAGRRVLVLSVGLPSSGVPASWGATADTAGVAFASAASDRSVGRIAESIDAHREPGDVVVVSIHWGSNWGYRVARQMLRFAHALVDAGVNIVHGHSSHHPRPIEVHQGSLILYGCGDLINDYEGISGYEQYRDDLRVMYLASLAADTGEFLSLRMVPFQARRMRLEHAARGDREWLRDTLDRVSRPFGTPVAVNDDGQLVVERS